jgi:hypothetical protein
MADEYTSTSIHTPTPTSISTPTSITNTTTVSTPMQLDLNKSQQVRSIIDPKLSQRQCRRIISYVVLKLTGHNNMVDDKNTGECYWYDMYGNMVCKEKPTKNGIKLECVDRIKFHAMLQRYPLDKDEEKRLNRLVCAFIKEAKDEVESSTTLFNHANEQLVELVLQSANDQYIPWDGVVKAAQTVSYKSNQMIVAKYRLNEIMRGLDDIKSTKNRCRCQYSCRF